jgi:hypothetical protein
MITTFATASLRAADLRRYMRRFAMGVSAVCALLGATPQAEAGSTQAAIAVSVMVMARTTLDSVSSPSQLEISADDVARGYVDVPGATRLVVTNTSRLGYVVSVWPQVQLFSAVVVSHGGYKSELGADGGEVFERHWGKTLPLLLDYRFMLAPGVKPGTYPWPLCLQVQAATF